MLRPLLFSTVLAAAACASPRPVPAGREAETRAYPFAATSSADGAFSYAQLGGANTFEWKTLTVTFDSRSLYEGTTVLMLIDLEVTNKGAKPFGWDDYTPYLAIADEAGEWNYRMLFTQSKARTIAPGKTAKLRYYARLAGQGIPQRHVFVMQSLFGGLDAGFPFVASAAR